MSNTMSNTTADTIVDKTKQLFNKSKDFVKGFFSKQPASANPSALNDLNIHGIEVKEADGGIQSQLQNKTLITVTTYYDPDETYFNNSLNRGNKSNVKDIHYFNENEDKRIQDGDKIYELHNNIFSVYNKDTNQLVFQKSYQTQHKSVSYPWVEDQYTGTIIQRSKGQFPVLNQRLPTGEGMDFYKPDRYQSTYAPQDEYIRTQYYGPTQFVEYDPQNRTFENVDIITDTVKAQDQTHTLYTNISTPDLTYENVSLPFDKPVISEERQLNDYQEYMRRKAISEGMQSQIYENISRQRHPNKWARQTGSSQEGVSQEATFVDDMLIREVPL